MRRIIVYSILLCSVLLCSCGTGTTEAEQPTKQEITGIVLSSDEVEIAVGESVQIPYTIVPEAVSEYSVAWESTDETLVSVDDAGVVTGISPGATNVVVSCDNGVYAKCMVTVQTPSAYEQLDDDDKALIDAFVVASDNFYNPQSASFKYVYRSATGDCWNITVSAQNQMGGYSEQDYTLYNDGKIEEPILSHIDMPGANDNLDMLNAAIAEQIGQD